MTQVRLAIDQSALQDIEQHLRAVQYLFQPPLAQRVNLHQYAEKLFASAIRFEGWQEDRLIGLVAAYAKATARTYFITNVSVASDSSRHGLGTALLQRCIDAFDEKGFTAGTLEVHGHNHVAVSLYRRLGFELFETEGESYRMRRFRNRPSGEHFEKP